MSSNAIIDHPTSPLLLLGGRAATVGLALTIMAYGFVMPPEYPFASELAASDIGMPGQASVEGTWSVMPPAYVSRAAAASDSTASIDAPRECAVDKGIIDSCTFD